MKRRSQGTAVLFELTIVVLFFALSASVILGVFMSGHDMSVRAAALERATYVAQGWAERVGGSDAPEEYLTSVGFESETGEVWRLTDQEAEIRVQLSAEMRRAGVLWRGSVEAAQGGEVAALDLSWYAPAAGEAIR